MSKIEQITDVPDEILEALKQGEQAALDATRKFVETVNSSLGSDPDTAAKHKEVIDSAFKTVDHLVAAQFEFVQKVVRSSVKPLRQAGEGESKSG